jgi:hypothetical protein
MAQVTIWSPDPLLDAKNYLIHKTVRHTQTSFREIDAYFVVACGITLRCLWNKDRHV